MADIPIILGAGELLWDCFPDVRRPGGAPANVAFHARQLGLDGVVVSRLGQDALGDEMVAYLEQHGLSTNFIGRDAGHATGQVDVDLSDTDHPAFTIREDAAWDYLTINSRTEELARRASALCYGTLAQRNRQSREAIHRLIRATSDDCLRVYDVNLRPPWFEREWIEQSLRAADIVKLNDDETGQLAPLLSLASTEPVDVARELHRNFQLDLVCVTRGAQGCILVSRDEATEEPGVEVRSADPVGAGDAFTAAMIFARLRGWPLAMIAAFSNQIGAIVASRQGAMPATETEYKKLLAKFEQS